jgi:hypothetical protein
MGKPDGYGGGYGNPEQGEALQSERQKDLVRQAERDHVAHDLQHHEPAIGNDRPWWKKILRRT